MKNRKINFEAWAKTAVQFIRSKGLETEFTDWCGGWSCPIKTGKGDVDLAPTLDAMDELKSTLKRAEKELLWASEQFEGGEVLRLAAAECRAALLLGEMDELRRMVEVNE